MQSARPIHPLPVRLENGILQIADKNVLTVPTPAWTVSPDATETGIFLRATPVEAHCYEELPLGRIIGLRRYTSCQRPNPFWLKPFAGSSEADIKPETLWILAETEAGDYTLIIPLLDNANRYSLMGSAAGLSLVIETGDPLVPSTPGIALFVATGTDPYLLLAASARAVAVHFGGTRLRVDKPVPDFVDLFGWCTWDAFYKEVTEEKLLAGLEVFATGGIRPPLLILDDGWQSYERFPTGEDRLVSLAPNDRFKGDLTQLIRTSKDRYGVRCFFVWHAFMGYWGGVDPVALPQYNARTQPRSFGPPILRQESTWNVLPWGALISVPDADRIALFYQDYHSRLSAQGVDGVKVDVQGMLEAVAAGQGGRVALHRAYRQGLDASVNQHFAGRLINCMSSTSECAYLANSTVMRSSDDFFPLKPESHGAHLHINAQVGLWFGEFMLPDWDMFQSTHARGSFHAASRAISGGPIYVSDLADAHDFAVLQKLVLSDGTILRADQPGKPTLDCLFIDPTREDVLLKIFNRNRDCGVVGLFNVRLGVHLKGSVRPADVHGLAGESFVGYAHQADQLWGAGIDTCTAFELPEGGWELVSYAPVENGFAAIGLVDKFNSTGAVLHRHWTDDRRVVLQLRDGGRFLAWAQTVPVSVNDNKGAALDFSYEQSSGRLTVDIPPGGPSDIKLAWC